MSDMQDRQVIISFNGVLSFSDISELLNQLKEEVEGKGERLVTYKKLIILTVEVLENIKKYHESQIRDEQLLKKYSTSFELSKSASDYFLMGKNLIKKGHQANIIEKIKKVNGLTSEELRALYRQVISNGQFSMEGGAGLGFIELAKTSEHNLVYSFEEVDNEYSYYILNLQLSV